MSAPEALLVSDMAKWNAMAEEIAILRAQNAAVLAANRNCVDAFNELMEERNELLQAVELFLERTEEPPEPNCSCHVAPPCGDCVNHASLREAFEFARAASAKATGATT